MAADDLSVTCPRHRRRRSRCSPPSACPSAACLLLPRADERTVVDVVQHWHVEHIEDRVVEAIFGRVRRARLAGRRVSLIKSKGLD